MLLFDLLFYSVLALSTIVFYALLKWHPPIDKKAPKYLKTIGLLICLIPWTWQLLLWISPKGSKWQEALHLPRHLWMLNNAPFKDGEQGQKINYGAHPRQYYYYYPAPNQSLKKNIVIFYLHGGGWCLGSPEQHKHLAYLLQKAGYTLIFPAYRLTPDFDYYHLQDDVNSALKHSFNFLQTQGINNIQLVIGGTSAGANLATLLAYDEQRWNQLNLDRSMLKGVFSIVGALDITEMEQTATLLAYTGSSDQASYTLANPIHTINALDSFPFLCLHGKKDGLVPYQAAASFCDKLSSLLPHTVDFRSFEQASHLELGAAWYYDKQSNLGQDTMLINWLNNITSPPF